MHGGDWQLVYKAGNPGNSSFAAMADVDNMLETGDFSLLYYPIPLNTVAFHCRKYRVQKRIVGDGYARYLRRLYSKKLNAEAATGSEEAQKKLQDAAFLVGAGHFCGRL